MNFYWCHDTNTVTLCGFCNSFIQQTWIELWLQRKLNSCVPGPVLGPQNIKMCKRKSLPMKSQPLGEEGFERPASLCIMFPETPKAVIPKLSCAYESLEDPVKRQCLIQKILTRSQMMLILLSLDYTLSSRPKITVDFSHFYNKKCRGNQREYLCYCAVCATWAGGLYDLYIQNMVNGCSPSSLKFEGIY